MRPWIRFFARTIDGLLWAILLAIPLYFTAPGLLDSGLLVTVIGHIVTVMMNASSFAVFGTTPGKYLLGVEVRTEMEERLSFIDALWREVEVLFRGMGLSIPIINLIAMGVAYGTLTSSRKTAWDRSGGFVVSHQPVSWLGGTIATILLVGVLTIGIWAKFSS